MKKQLALAILGVLGTVVAYRLVIPEGAKAAPATALEQCRHYVVDDTIDLPWHEDSYTSRMWDVSPLVDSEIVISVESLKNAPVDVDFAVVTKDGLKYLLGDSELDKRLADIISQLSMEGVKKGVRTYSPLPSFSSEHKYRVTVSLVGKGDVSLVQRLGTPKFPVKVKIFLSPADVDERIRRACCLEQNRGKE